MLNPFLVGRSLGVTETGYANLQSAAKAHPDQPLNLSVLKVSVPGREIIPVSARAGENVALLLERVVAALPEGPAFYPAEDYTAETERFLAQEMVREKLFLQTEQEIPYGTAVEIEEFSEKPEKGLVVVRANILVDRPTHKGIVIGAGGERLREIGRRARLELEQLLGVKVFLSLFVKVEPGWAENPRRLKELGL